MGERIKSTTAPLLTPTCQDVKNFKGGALPAALILRDCTFSSNMAQGLFDVGTSVVEYSQLGESVDTNSSFFLEATPNDYVSTGICMISTYGNFAGTLFF